MSTHYNGRKEEALKKDISSFLSLRGYKAVRESGSRLYYYSMMPGRSDSKPSFQVDTKFNNWRDFGYMKMPEDIIELVRRLDLCSFSEAIDTILNDKKEPVKQFVPSDKPSIPLIDVEDIGLLNDEKLVHYLCVLRKIDFDIARKYCQQALISFPMGKFPSRKHWVVAFKNDQGGYEFRNNFFKVSNSPKYYTSFIDEGLLGLDIFEGFIDFMSAIMMGVHYDSNAIILNGLTNFRLIYSKMKKVEPFVYIDNDRESDKALKEIDALGIQYIDGRPMYRFYNDLNDQLRGIPKL